jgi:hypothetical protein
MSITTITTRKWLGLGLLCASATLAAGCDPTPCERHALSNPSPSDVDIKTSVTAKTCSTDADCFICPSGVACTLNPCTSGVLVGQCGCVMGVCAYYEIACDELEHT